MIRCTSCGTENVDDAAFCDNCGTALSGPRPTGVTPPPYPSPAPAAGSGTSCPACGGAVMPGEAFCETCGIALSAPAPVQAPPPLAAQQGFLAPPPQPAATLQGVRLLIQLDGSEVALPDRPEAIIGRADTASHFFPDVDLDRFDALNNGVSRRHAKVLIQGGQVMIEDLDAANGTAVNRQRLAPHQAHAIRDGDEVRFGKLVATARLS